MKIKYCLTVFFIGFTSFAYSQQATDSVMVQKDGMVQKDTVVRNLSAKQLRKQKDSIVKSLAPIEGKAIVYIMRPTIMAFAITFQLDCDSFLVGWINAKTYLYTVLDPGEHVFKAQSENEFDLKLNLEAGKIYYLAQESRMGMLYSRNKLILLNETDGKKYLSKCTISNRNQYPLFPRSPGLIKTPPEDTP
jgi:hypothetical protein